MVGMYRAVSSASPYSGQLVENMFPIVSYLVNFIIFEPKVFCEFLDGIYVVNRRLYTVFQTQSGLGS